MIESKLIIDLFGIGFEIYLVMLFYGTFLQLKVIKKRFLVLGFISLASINFVKFLILDVPILFVLLSMFIIFMYGFFYVKSLSTWILFAFLLSALFFVSELVVAIIQTNVLGLPIENIQNMWLSYAIGMLCAKLFTLVLIYLIRLFVPLKKGAINNKWFNLLLLFLPLQSLMLCFLVLELSFTTDNYSAIFIGEIAVIISLVLIFATMYIIHNQLKAMAYKKEYEFAKQRWKTQIEHYDELYDTQKEIRSIRHDMNSTLLALSGLIEKGKTDEALKKINNTQKIIHKTDSVIDSGLPAIDAIMNAFVKKANDFGISIDNDIMIERLHIDQCDLAIIIANALDNAIEAINKSTGIKKEITVHISNMSGYLIIIIKNQASSNLCSDFQTTKEDKLNHGFGMKNMSAIVKKYDGSFSASYDRELKSFSVKILIKNQEVRPLVTKKRPLV